MKMTAEIYKAIDDYKYNRFIQQGVMFLYNNFYSLIKSLGVTSEPLENSINQSYIWTCEKNFPSPLLAIRLTCAKLCFGSFFMEDVRYTELNDIVKKYVNNRMIYDEDNIHNYIVKYKADWSSDWFSEHYKHSWGPDTPHCIIPQYHNAWLGSGQIFTRLYTVEKRTAFSPTGELYENIYRQLMTSASLALSRYESGRQAEVLLAVAQYYDGFRCFDDPLRPRWYGCLNLGQQEYAYWRLLDIFTKTVQENR
ncbi:hypothetical protein ACS3KU_003959 [Escherichia coli]